MLRDIFADDVHAPGSRRDRPGAAAASLSADRVGLAAVALQLMEQPVGESDELVVVEARSRRPYERALVRPQFVAARSPSLNTLKQLRDVRAEQLEDDRTESDGLTPDIAPAAVGVRAGGHVGVEPEHPAHRYDVTAVRGHPDEHPVRGLSMLEQVPVLLGGNRVPRRPVRVFGHHRRLHRPGRQCALTAASARLR
jgi:hypothetical protein